MKKPLDNPEKVWYINLRCKTRGYSSAGRALEWHSRGQRFDPAYLHQSKRTRESVSFCFGGDRMWLMPHSRRLRAGFRSFPSLYAQGHPHGAPAHTLSLRPPAVAAKRDRKPVKKTRRGRVFRAWDRSARVRCSETRSRDEIHSLWINAYLHQNKDRPSGGLFVLV